MLQGTRTFVLQDDDGNIELTHSISAGLDYAAVGPEHAWLRELGRAEYAYVDRRRSAGGVSAAGAARRHSPGARVVARDRVRARRSRASSGRRRSMLVNLSGRGDKDVHERRTDDGRGCATTHAWRRRSQRLPSRGKRPGLVTYTTAGDPDLPRSADILHALDRAGADVLEVGVPFSDPLADGPVIQRATERALAAGGNLRGVARHDRRAASQHARRRS